VPHVGVVARAGPPGQRPKGGFRRQRWGFRLRGPMPVDDTEHAYPRGAERRLRAGDVVAGRYEIEALLGAGGMGAVYRVQDRVLGHPVALKVLAHSSGDAVERFTREVVLARRVTHPNIVRTHDLGTDAMLTFLTMELVEGRPLDAILIERGALPVEEVVQLGVGIAEGLQAAHDAGVVHRDLKPANVLVLPDGGVRITDFGIARGLEDPERTHQTGAILGTPHYMAPEQVAGQEVDGRTDLYALGCILYHLLTGLPPYRGETPIAVASQRLLFDAPEDPRQHATIPDPLATLVLRLLRRERAQRPASAREVVEVLGGRTLGPTGSRTGPFAPLPGEGQPTVAVLPFRHRGPAEHDYLGEGLAEELIDVLARTRGLRALSLGATARFAEERDPRTVAEELGASAVVDGSVRMAGDRVRVRATLVDGASGLQLWGETYEAPLGDVFALQESMGRRIAEALRVEVTAATARQRAPKEAVALYLRGRRGLMADVFQDPERAVSELERSLELAPELEPAIAALAMASVRAWWGFAPDPGGARARRAEQNVRRALEDVPDNGEAQLAQAMLAAQKGDFVEAAAATGRALERIPTLAFAHQYLGALQIEAGREREGQRRLELALELDPTLDAAHFSLARLTALEGDLGDHRRHMAAVERRAGGPTLPLLGLGLRCALWRGDATEAHRCWAALHDLESPLAQQSARLFGVGVGETAPAEGAALAQSLSDAVANPRFTAMIEQIATEMLLVAGDREGSLAALERAAEGALVDVVWLRRCALLEPLHDEERFHAVLRRVDRRARRIFAG